ncbi:hypothetical protein HDE_01606 [Halotydeus destructor]|nr:hypothetical protein HDE_01606 [Halotydeus destructor]
MSQTNVKTPAPSSDNLEIPRQVDRQDKSLSDIDKTEALKAKFLSAINMPTTTQDELQSDQDTPYVTSEIPAEEVTAIAESSSPEDQQREPTAQEILVGLEAQETLAVRYKVKRFEGRARKGGRKARQREFGLNGLV